MPRQFHTPPGGVNAKTRRAFQRDLLRWYRRHRRALPWRDTRDPYRVWVSEIMLQQTRVETVLDYYRRWLEAFPDLETLAAAPEVRVLKMWEGLGYYSRARNLHRAARQANGRVPDTVAALLELPGIGRYTAGAIASIAFGRRAPIVDGNVARVFARVFAREDQHWETAEQLLPARHCGDFNQALMELGALVCTPRSPACDRCPLQPVCLTRSDALPRRKRLQLRQETHDVLWVRAPGKVLLRQRPQTGLLAGMWELPAGRSRRLLFTHRHAITTRLITLRVYAGRATGGRWFSDAELQEIAMPAAHRRAVTHLLSTQDEDRHVGQP